MAARLKSSVLRREEKGIGSISMARLIVSGMMGGAIFMGMQLLGIPLLMIPAGLVTFIAGLILTAPRHGIPLYRHLQMTLLTRLMLIAQADPDSIAAAIVKFIGVQVDSLSLDTSIVLSAPLVYDENGTLDDWEILPDSDHESGFEIISDTLQPPEQTNGENTQPR